MKPSEKLKQLREESGLSRPKFAEKLGVKPHTIRHIEEENQTIQGDLALALEKEYNIPYKYWRTGLELNQEESDEATKQAKAQIDACQFTEQEIISIANMCKNGKKEALIAFVKAAEGDKEAIQELKGMIKLL